jgi:hypothetical protein
VFALELFAVALLLLVSYLVFSFVIEADLASSPGPRPVAAPSHAVAVADDAPPLERAA